MYATGDVKQAMNYGDRPIFSDLPPGPNRELAQDRFNTALVFDLVARLYPHSGWSLTPGDSEALYRAPKFELKQTNEQYRVVNTILTEVHDYSKTGQRIFPLSFHVVNIIQYLEFLVQALNKNKKPLEPFRSKMTEFWTDKDRYGKPGPA
jgi:hypothetical protein